MSNKIPLRLDGVGKGCFAHDFGLLDDDHHPVIEALESVEATKPSLALQATLFLAPHFPSLATRIPNGTSNALKALCKAVKDDAEQMLMKAHKDNVMNGGNVDKTLLGALGPFYPLFPLKFVISLLMSNRSTVKGKDADPDVHMAIRVCALIPSNAEIEFLILKSSSWFVSFLFSCAYSDTHSGWAPFNRIRHNCKQVLLILQ